MKKHVYAFSIALMSVLSTNGQVISSDNLLHQKSVQLNIGTQGAGLELNYKVMPKTSLRLGANFIPLAANNVFEISGFNSTSKVGVNFYNAHLFADVIPFNRFRNVRIVGGFGYFFRANGNARINPTDNYTYGDIVLTSEQVGHIDLDIKWKGLAPYLGFAFGNLYPGKRFNVGFDLGTYYLSRPDARITGTGILEGNSTQESQLESNIKNYRWLPVLQLNFNFKI
ncbi:hypothetical protein [Arcticibacter tournemirensis]